MEALAPNGYVRWRRELGTLAHACRQLRGDGVTGTPVVDPGTRSLYVADAFGLLHALDLASGAEREGWPVRLYAAPTASSCEARCWPSAAPCTSAPAQTATGRWRGS